MSYIRFVFYALTAIVLLASCQREVSDILPTGNNPSDSTETPSSSLIRKIHVTGHSFSDSLNLTFSIQYDTLASKIVVLADDSTGALVRPDVKGVVYEYNKAGYLIKSDGLYKNGTTQPDFAILRNAANKIEKIVDYDTEEVNGVSYNDTIYYRYGSEISGDSVMIDNSRYISRYVSFFDKKSNIKWFKHYHNNDLADFQVYHYDAQGNISRIAATYDTIDYTYATVQDSGWQKLPKLFLGNDAHVLMQEQLSFRLGYNFLSYIIEGKWETVYNPLFTQPLTRMVQYGKRFFIPDDEPTRSEIIFKTTYTPDGKIETITAMPDNGDLIQYTFLY